MSKETMPQLTDAEETQLRALIETKGERGLIEAIEVPRNTLARVLGRLPVRRGTVAQVRAGLVRLGGSA